MAPCHPSNERCNTCSELKRRTKKSWSRWAVAVAVVAAVGVAKPGGSKTWPTSSSWRWTSCRTSTRRCSAAQQQQADNTVDELMERLRELARRQEREAERQRMRSRGQQSAQGSGTAAQRELAEEAEEAARRLERLAREQNSPQMMDAARRLQEAADAMRRAAANNDNLGFAEAGAALDRLRDVQDRLRQEQTGRLERDIEEALRRANRLADEEREIASGVNALPDLSDEQQLERLQGLMERKDAMETEVADLERQIDSTSAEFRREERGASSSLQDASNSIRDNKLKEKIRYTKGVIRSPRKRYRACIRRSDHKRHRRSS